ncbi:hypothetical protein [Paraliomyxa miuraensis]|uniref:hypothetical protein n=1 Tax=Paraliomyxa miuraensis TaxID=376150 RepID=UPI002259FFFA|nr:hypothetical protein [Paraliomyxa miuraensis]MCX4247491.1 hypothetical protein [Paraliomyxa miuraensis]
MRLRARSLLSTLGPTLALATAFTSACSEDETKGPSGEGPGAAGSSTPDATSTKSSAGLPDEGPLPTLRTGMREPVRLDPVKAMIVRQATEGGVHYFELTLPSTGQPGDEVLRVNVDGSAHAVAAVERSGGETMLLVRVVGTPTAPTTLSGTTFLAGDRPEGHVFLALPFTADEHAPSTGGSPLAARWAAAFGEDLRGNRHPWWLPSTSHPWREFAAGRVQAVIGGSGPGGEIGLDSGARPRRTELSELMHTTTAATSMQEALQHDRGLRLRFEAGAATVPIAELKTPELIEHPWTEMMAALPDPKAAAPEPLARATPAGFWYARFDDIRLLLRVLDEADAWITPVAHIMEERAEVRDLAQRYQRQLGLRRTGLAKVLGHTVIERVALMGSDPYLREGSDLTFVFQLENQTVFDTELSRHMDEHRAEIPGIVQSTITHGEHTITVHRDPTGAVRQHRAQAGDLAVVSNSEAAIRAVLDAIDGKARRLSDDQDLAYMLARDPGEHDAFAFLGDRFIAQVVGPRQKVLAARRQQALAELLTPGYAALLHGWLEGKAPADTEAIIAAGLLDRDELVHGERAGGEPITFEPGGIARSATWGSPDALTPLLDLPAPTLVTEAERNAYDQFARGYQDYWRQFIDPIAIRLDLEDQGEGSVATIDVRVLPLISGTDYGDIEEIVGTERISVPAIDDGLQAVWAVGAESGLRRDLDRAASMLTGKADIGLGWLGDWVMLGTLDRKPLVDLLVEVEEDIQLPATEVDLRKRDLELAKRAGKLPVYAAAHVRNAATLVGTLTAIRAAVNEVGPGMVQWGEHSRYRDQAIVRVGVDPKAPGEVGAFAEAIALYYVQAGEAFVVALDPKILEALIDRVLDGGGPTRGVEAGPQFVMEARLTEERAGWTALAWALQGQANRTQGAARSAAEILLRGDPSIGTPEQLMERGRAYFGAYPVSASGRSDFVLTPHGASDPVHGSEIAPAYPKLPVEQSPIAVLMARLTGMRATVAFDREPAKLEPPARSLHTTLQVHLGAAKD